MAKILVVEENNSLRRLMKDQLELLGHEVIEAKDGFEILETMSMPDIEKKINLIISEIDIEPVNGLSLMKMIRRIYGEIPFIIETHFDGYKKEALASGASGFLKKVFGLFEFKEVVQKVLEENKNKTQSPA